MEFQKVVEIFKRIGVVPVIKMDHPKHAVPLAKALMKGGVEAIEITFRSDAARESIKNIRELVPDILVGAGTVLSIEQANQAIEAGAQFLVSPGFNPELTKFTIDKNIPYFPGVNNPTAIEQAMAFNLNVLKFFPAEESGGCKTLKALGAPYQNIQFMPTGGINTSNLNQYLSLPNVIAIGGSWLATAEMIQNETFSKVEELSAEAIQLVLGFELAHIGVNTENEEEALVQAEKVQRLFHFPVKDGNSSAFSGSFIEWMKKPFLGKHGHIAIKTNNISAAIYYLEKKGIKFKEDTKKEKDGRIIAIYLDLELAGFAIHLLSK